MNRYVVGSNGLTSYQRFNGRRANSKAVEFGEKVCDNAPKKLRSKMQSRWRIGIYLGVAGNSGEHYIGTWTVELVTTRSIVRAVEQAHSKTYFVDRRLGTPARPTPDGRDAYERVEECDDPHAMIDVEADNPASAQRATDALHKRNRITQADCRNNGFTGGCACCEALQEGHPRNHLRHTEWCRIRIGNKPRN